MIETATKSGIVIREIVDEKTIHKVDTRPLEKALEAIDLSKYGTGIKEILFIVVALPPSDSIHKDEIVYNRRNRKLTLELNLNYSQVLNSITCDVLKMSATLILDSINLLKERKDFKTLLFKENLIKTFSDGRFL